MIIANSKNLVCNMIEIHLILKLIFYIILKNIQNL